MYFYLFQEIDESTLVEKPNIYCHFAQGFGEPKYMPVRKWSTISHLLQEALTSYNDLIAGMNLVLFEDAMIHICRYDINLFLIIDQNFTKIYCFDVDIKMEINSSLLTEINTLIIIFNIFNHNNNISTMIYLIFF